MESSELNEDAPPEYTVSDYYTIVNAIIYLCKFPISEENIDELYIRLNRIEKEELSKTLTNYSYSTLESLYNLLKKSPHMHLDLINFKLRNITDDALVQKIKKCLLILDQIEPDVGSALNKGIADIVDQPSWDENEQKKKDEIERIEQGIKDETSYVNELKEYNNKKIRQNADKEVKAAAEAAQKKQEAAEAAEAAEEEAAQNKQAAAKEREEESLRRGKEAVASHVKWATNDRGVKPWNTPTGGTRRRTKKYKTKTLRKRTVRKHKQTKKRRMQKKRKTKKHYRRRH